MSESFRSPFEFAPLTEYTLKDRILIRLSDLVFYWLSGLLAVIRFEVEGLENFDAIADAGKVIYSVWRPHLSGIYFCETKDSCNNSQSRMVKVYRTLSPTIWIWCNTWFIDAGELGPLVDMIRTMRAGAPTFTVEVKGPRYRAKPGAVILAKKTGNRLCRSWLNRRILDRKSWDRLRYPGRFRELFYHR